MRGNSIATVLSPEGNSHLDHTAFVSYIQCRLEESIADFFQERPSPEFADAGGDGGHIHAR